MINPDKINNRKRIFITLTIAFFISAFFKLLNINTGSPFVTIDDITTFNGGFLVWFGEAPSQRMYIESWICGVSSLITFIIKMIVKGNIGNININIVANAYRDFYGYPD